MMDSYYFQFNEEVVQDNDRTITMTWDENGTAIDVSAWDVYFKATASHTTDVIEVLPALVTKIDSGTGTVDSFVIELTGDDTNVDPGFYGLEITVDRGGNVDTICRGTLTITERVVEV